MIQGYSLFQVMKLGAGEVKRIYKRQRRSGRIADGIVVVNTLVIAVLLGYTSWLEVMSW